MIQVRARIYGAKNKEIDYLRTEGVNINSALTQLKRQIAKVRNSKGEKDKLRNWKTIQLILVKQTKKDISDAQ